MKKRLKTWLTSIMASVFALSVFGGVVPIFATKKVNAATETQVVNPYIEWNFDDATKFYANTGTSASDTTKDYTLQKWGGEIAAPGYVSFTENAMLYPKENPFVDNEDLTDFTLVMDVNASVASYYGTLFSFDSFSKSGDNHEKITRMDVRQPSSAAGRWMGWGDSKVHTINNSWSSWQKLVYQDSSALQNNTTVTTGNVTVVFSVDSDSSIRVRVYKDGVKVSDDGEVSTVSLPTGWSLYNENSAHKKFTLGAAHDARYFNYETGTLTNVARQMKGTMDNIRIYDFAMTEEQMSKYATDKQITQEVEIPEPTYTAEINPYIEYTFDSVANFTKNTGSSASDSTKDYTLKINGSADANALQYDGYANFSENASLYIPMENNPFISDLTDFTITVDVNAGLPQNWYGSIFSWDSFTNFTNTGSGSEIDKYSRISTRYATSTSNVWFRLCDTYWKDSADYKLQYNSYLGGKNFYVSETKTETSGLSTIVYSLEQGKTLKVKAYQNGVQIGTPLSLDISSWSLYDASSTYKTFMIGGCYDTRYITDLTTFTSAQKFVGTMDNIRIYDFAMTEEQMSEYAVNKSLSTSGIQIAESENGTVSVDNYTPAIGEEVVFNVGPNNGYELSELKVNGEAIEAVDGVYKTTMIRDGLYVEATFKKLMKIVAAETVSMAHGAGIRYGGALANSGLRFQMVASQADYEGLEAKLPIGATVEYGILVIPADYQTTYGAFTVENFFGANAKYHMAEKNDDGSLKAYDGTLPQIMNFWTSELYLNEETGIYEYFGSITGIKEENLTRKFVGVGVVKYSYEDKAEYVVVEYANNDIANDTRSIYQVAKLAAQDDKLNASAKLWIQTNYIDVVENAVTQLSGKKLSILGDSISTFTGVSNDTNANATIGDNEVFYYKQMTMDDTWWKQAADAADMSILVNNSWAGSNVATNYGNETKGGCTARAENLHDVNGVTPDIIAVYMGINDCGCLTDLGEFDSVSDVWDGTQYVGDTEKFATAYATMVHKLTTKYDAAEVFLFTLPRNNYLWQGTKEQYNALQDKYNKMIYKIADVFGCQVVDVAASVGEDYSAYLLNDGIHPNAKGMDIITAAFETALYSYYYATLN